MNEKKLVQNFKSYINVSPKNNAEKNGAFQEVKPKLLNGEQVAGAAHNVVMLAPLSERDEGRYGSLFVTNYRLSFVPLEMSQNDECGQRNLLLGAYDVPLTAVCGVFLREGGRRRRVSPGADISGKVKGLQVVCKNMKVLTFAFSRSGPGRTLCLALLHHAFPRRHDLLFAFEYREPYYPTLPADLNMFLRASDWRRELDRCSTVHWRVSVVNGSSDAFARSAAAALVVPAAALDCQLVDAARHFRSGRVPMWVWGKPEGAALLRSAELLPTEQAATAESVLLEQVRRSHPKLTPPHVIYLCGNSYTGAGSVNALPALSSLQTSFKKLLDLCTPTTLSEFWLQDSQYYSHMESSRWLRHVTSCLVSADTAATKLHQNISVVLQEGDGVDYCAVVSSLTQLLIDPHFRTIVGFQSLIQKEWIALGHPFCDRLGLPRPGYLKDDKDSTAPPSQIAPVFLLFLDCVWQLQNQFPSDFQFTETYLTTLWDCTHNHVFDTFLFNCPRDRELAVSKNFIQRPLWDWGEQFNENDIQLFYNPLYTENKPVNNQNNRMSLTPQPPKPSRLSPSVTISAVELWSQCYERWLQPLDAVGAGQVQFHAHNYALGKEIRRLKEKVLSLSIMSNRQSNGETESEPIRWQPVSRFHPFSQNRRDDIRDLDVMQVSLIDATQLIDSQSLLNAPD